MDSSIEKVLSHFFTGHFSQVRRIESGHINDTYLVTGDVPYICQKLKGSLFDGKSQVLEDNYKKYCRAYEAVKEQIPDWSIPEWLPCRDGGLFYQDSDGSLWRVYRYIEGEVKTGIEGAEQAFSVGEGLARLHLILAEMSELPEPVIPHFHALSWYLEQYMSLDGKDCNRDAKLDRLIGQKAVEYMSIKLPTDQAIHGDAKLSNAIFSEEGRIICFIDMDTLMPGNTLTDLADCIRSCCIKDGKLDRALWQEIFAGYRSVRGDFGEDELELLPRIVQKNCFELGLRYYTDALSGNVYFEESYPGQNMEKAVRYLELSEMNMP
ncbi:MAG: aminoglycoside phosphotransferase family protein [Lachnospiraceae bacterium]|nr:aminoglycoside phosphotransferase family protein [Lachnospiraceae bacterium]